MATYVIGDVQGCFDALMKLIRKIGFDQQSDRLVFCGDLVNRGGRSLDTLRWIYAHQRCCQTVLGNHDLSLLGRFYKNPGSVSNKEFKAIFRAPDVSLLMAWLMQCPLYLDLGEQVVIHAGLYPGWDLTAFKKLADDTHVEMNRHPTAFFNAMYGNNPKSWDPEVDEPLRHRFVINATTRMRFVKTDLSLNFTENKKQPKSASLKPWFTFPVIQSLPQHIIFGHWSALGLYQDQHVTCLDSGKVWGGQLTAMRLEDRQLFSV
ncbi:symmetrical bis(5'-nucleosyl)-tetraphosphatase [Marinicella sediminis]|uniref:bis(5'-nucleosyl)-tetraphosphatase (symmetrical) n=1 Tax=Marinicella sediminis TaxID=1792834 RepID=A0ABV7JC00_9GAMM|nr:symmetrical bis(5'-nucleosyl)-tetraphosphatase [Marinicella sediminis]